MNELIQIDSIKQFKIASFSSTVCRYFLAGKTHHQVPIFEIKYIFISGNFLMPPFKHELNEITLFNDILSMNKPRI